MQAVIAITPRLRFCTINRCPRMMQACCILFSLKELGGYEFSGTILEFSQAQSHSRPSPGSRPGPGKFYRPRDHEVSPLFQVVREYFDEFERVYPERYQKACGYWRPVIRASIDKFLKCRDLKEGFARVRCPAPLKCPLRWHHEDRRPDRPRPTTSTFCYCR